MCILLCSCAPASEDIRTELNAVFKTENVRETIRRNNYSDYIDYYVPSDTSQMECSTLASRFSYNNASFIMEVNVSGIINERYYPEEELAQEDFFDDSKLIYFRKSTYTDTDGNEHDYLYKVYSYGDEVLSCFTSRDLIFYGYGNKGDLIAMSSRILLMAKGAVVRGNDVISAYSSKNEVDYEKKQVNLFETIMPVNGNVSDFMIDKEENNDSD